MVVIVLLFLVVALASNWSYCRRGKKVNWIKPWKDCLWGPNFFDNFSLWTFSSLGQLYQHSTSTFCASLFTLIFLECAIVCTSAVECSFVGESKWQLLCLIQWATTVAFCAKVLVNFIIICSFCDSRFTLVSLAYSIKCAV